jgi:hypothetical protein
LGGQEINLSLTVYSFEGAKEALQSLFTIRSDFVIHFLIVRTTTTPSLSKDQHLINPKT